MLSESAGKPQVVHFEGRFHFEKPLCQTKDVDQMIVPKKFGLNHDLV